MACSIDLCSHCISWTRNFANGMRWIGQMLSNLWVIWNTVRLKRKLQYVPLDFNWYYALSYLFTPWSRVLLEKLTSFQLVKKFPAFYGTWRFVIAFTNAHHLFLSWASLIQSILPHPTSWRSILILSFHLSLGLPSGLLPSGSPTETLHAPLLSPIRAICPAHLILLDFTTRTILNEE